MHTLDGWTLWKLLFRLHGIDEKCRVLVFRLMDDWKWSVICTRRVWMSEGI